MDIGAVIVTLRKEKQVKQKDLAKSLNISATYLSLIEHNEARPSINLLAQIAEFFDLPVTALLFKGLNIDELKSGEQKKYFKAAQPIVDALMKYLLLENTSRGKDPLVRINGKVDKRILSKAV